MEYNTDFALDYKFRRVGISYINNPVYKEGVCIGCANHVFASFKDRSTSG
jgi:hypothetical protein